MTFDVDPDVRLFTRLNFGRGWRQSPNALLWLGGIVALASGRIISLGPRSVPYGNPNLRAAALLGLMLAPSRPIARLIDLEYRGLLDQLRLSSRSPSRLLTAALVGSMWPLLALVVAIYGVNGVWFHGQLATVGFGVIAFVVLLDLGAAMTTAIALLGHELWHRSAAMAILAPVVVLACVVRWSPEPRYFARVSLLPSVVPNSADAAVLLLTLGVLTAAHVFVRRQRHVPLMQA